MILLNPDSLYLIILRNKENDKYKLYQKLTRYLIGRGYGYDLVSRVVKKIINEE